jgi:glycosyltransferase involved in cell wall biosynthesis
VRIAVNTRLLLPHRLEGLGNYTLELLKPLVNQHPEHTFLFFYDRKPNLVGFNAPNIEHIFAGPPARHPLLFYLWFEWTIPRLLKKHKADLFFSPEGYLSLSAKLPQICVMHDLNFEVYPQFFDVANRWYYRTFFPKFAQKANRIITVSQFSAEDIASRYSINPSKISVIYNGVSDEYASFPVNDYNETIKQISSNTPYFLFIGGLYKRKNLMQMLKAFALFRQQYSLPVKFIISGNHYPESKEIINYAATLHCADDIVFTGRIEPREMASALMNHAIGLLYVSLYEGFGLPIVEAMRSQCPVITGNITAMPEIGGNAVLTADPFDENSICNAMLTLVASEEMRSRMKEMGIKQAEKFSWSLAADKLWNVMMEVLENPNQS